MPTVTVLQLVASTDRRGAETFALDLEPELTDRGFQVHTVALAAGSVGGLPVDALGRQALSLSTMKALRQHASSAHVVVAHGSTTLPACALALTGTGTPFVYRNIGDPTYWATTWVRRLRTSLFLTRARCVVALTGTAQRSLRDLYRIPGSKVRVIPSGVPATRHPEVTAAARRDARRDLGIPDDAKVGAVVAALSNEKGVDLAIGAMATANLDVLIVAGDGPERAALERLATREAPGRVQFLGSLDDPGIAYAAADVVVLPSRTEGLPGVLIEAGMRALPTVATDVGYVRDIVVDGDTGIVVQPGDAGAIADGLRRCFALDPGAGARARRRCVARFDLGVVADAWASALREVVAGRPDRQ